MKSLRHLFPSSWLPAVLAPLALAAGCAVGPNYHRPAVTTAMPTAYKEAAGWQPARPSDAVLRGAWWEVFQDPILDDLEKQVAASNQSLRQAAANYEEARELARADRATFFPDFTAAGGAERSQTASNGSANTNAATGITVGTAGESHPINVYSASVGATWAPDIWGKIRRTTEADVAAAQSSAATLAATVLSTQASLAQDYVELRILDEKKLLLDNAASDYRRTLKISENKYAVGVAARSDVVSAQAQLDGIRAQAVDVGVQRSQLEHAIAVLLGRPPAEFSLQPRNSVALTIVVPPTGLPANLLERRPDIAAAEREVASANARIGVQTAAYFPDLTLSADGGYQGSTLSRLFEAPNRFWSLGANMSDTIFDFGERRAQVLEVRAAYDGTVANYRETVLAAFQQVEDNLAALRILEQEAQIEEATVNEAAEAARITVNEYNAGTVDYTTVATAEVNELTARESALVILQGRLVASLTLIEALGGGWTTADLPMHHHVMERNPPSGEVPTK